MNENVPAPGYVEFGVREWEGLNVAQVEPNQGLQSTFKQALVRYSKVALTQVDSRDPAAEASSKGEGVDAQAAPKVNDLRIGRDWGGTNGFVELLRRTRRKRLVKFSQRVSGRGGPKILIHRFERSF